MKKSKVRNNICSVLSFMQEIGGSKTYVYICIKQHWKDKQEINLSDYLQKEGKWDK